MQIQYILQPDDYVALNLYLAQRDPAMRRRVRIIQVVGVCCIVALGAVVSVVLYDGIDAGLLLYVAIAGLYAYFVQSLLKNSLRARVHEVLGQREHSDAPRSLRIADDGLVFRCAGKEEVIAYAQISALVRQEAYLFILTHARDAFAVPLAAFEDADDSHWSLQNLYLYLLMATSSPDSLLLPISTLP